MTKLELSAGSSTSALLAIEASEAITKDAGKHEGERAKRSSIAKKSNDRSKPRIAPRVAKFLKDYGPLPEHPIKAGQVYFHQVGEEIGCSAQLLADPTKPHRAKLEAHARKFGFKPATVSPRRRARPVMPRLVAYIDALRSAGRRIPASIAHPDQPDWQRIAEAIDVEGWALRSPKLPYRAYLLDKVAELGLESIEPVALADGPITLVELEAAMRRDRDAGVYDKGAPSSIEQRKKATDVTASALRAAADIAPGAMKAEAATAIANAISTLDPNGQRRVISELKFCAEALASFETSGLPVSLAGALNHAIGRCGLPFAAVGRETGITDTALRDWASGSRNPPRNKFGKLSVLEDFLKLPRGSLTGRYVSIARPEKTKTVRVRSSWSGEAGPRRSKHGRALQTLFPRDWPLLVANGAPVYERSSWWPDQLRHERDDYFMFKSVKMDTRRRTRTGDLWSPGTLSARDSELGRLFSYVARNYAEFEGTHDLLTFALLINAAFVERFIQSRSSERQSETDAGWLTSFDLGLMRTCRSLFEAGVGWAAQDPTLADRLVPVANTKAGPSEPVWLISPEDIEAAKADWSAVCARAYAAYSELISSSRKSVQTNTDHSSIESILRLADPYLAFRLGRDGVAAEIKTLVRGSVAYCLAVRDLILWGIAARTGLREENYDLSYKPDNSGEFRGRQDGFEIVMSHMKFKNKWGPYFRLGKGKYRNYYKALRDDGVFYWAVREWLEFCRPLLLAGRESDRLFIGKGGNDLAPSALGPALMGTYRRHVMWNPKTGSGIEGAGDTGPHFVRAVLATGVLKATGSVVAAAAAIHDSIETVTKHYLPYVSDVDDKVDAALDELGKATKDEGDGDPS